MKTIRIEIKAPLKNIESSIDTRDNKRLTIIISEMSDNGTEIFHKFLLLFENASN